MTACLLLHNEKKKSLDASELIEDHCGGPDLQVDFPICINQLYATDHIIPIISLEAFSPSGRTVSASC